MGHTNDDNIFRDLDTVFSMIGHYGWDKCSREEFVRQMSR